MPAIHLPPLKPPVLRLAWSPKASVIVHCVITGCPAKAGGQTLDQAIEGLATHYAIDHPEFGQRSKA